MNRRWQVESRMPFCQNLNVYCASGNFHVYRLFVSNILFPSFRCNHYDLHYFCWMPSSFTLTLFLQRKLYWTNSSKNFAEFFVFIVNTEIRITYFIYYISRVTQCYSFMSNIYWFSQCSYDWIFFYFSAEISNFCFTRSQSITIAIFSTETFRIHVNRFI